ncbi:hypothetical protein GCM10010435_17670 [Winogradskya consettensis]|uniref:Uncharacterized protein n=1 Tax=Winogradskya consettensis TaxID=113560 RepID=A0A919VVR8_9ACTN|nr:hypothetical protein [Actinoplanes consettensis]GIM78626.1 hypothetical protein Aco04nite_61380 [Actinoplanes consettensis]
MEAEAMRRYVRDVGAAALQGVLTGVWVAAGELAPGRRRAVRVASVVGLSAVASIRDWAFPETEEAAEEEVAAVEGEVSGLEPDEEASVDVKRLVVGGVLIAASVGVIVGRKRLERRWLGRLERGGHAHPYRALGVRMGALSFAGTLAGKAARRRF